MLIPSANRDIGFYTKQFEAPSAVKYLACFHSLKKGLPKLKTIHNSHAGKIKITTSVGFFCCPGAYASRPCQEPRNQQQIRKEQKLMDTLHSLTEPHECEQVEESWISQGSLNTATAKLSVLANIVSLPIATVRKLDSADTRGRIMDTGEESQWYAEYA